MVHLSSLWSPYSNSIMLRWWKEWKVPNSFGLYHTGRVVWSSDTFGSMKSAALFCSETQHVQSDSSPAMKGTTLMDSTNNNPSPSVDNSGKSRIWLVCEFLNLFKLTNNWIRSPSGAWAPLLIKLNQSGGVLLGEIFNDQTSSIDPPLCFGLFVGKILIQ